MSDFTEHNLDAIDLDVVETNAPIRQDLNCIHGDVYGCSDPFSNTFSNGFTTGGWKLNQKPLNPKTRR